MRVYRSLIIIVGLLLLAGAGSAGLIPDQNSTITSSADWVIVNHQSTIFITARNGTSNVIPGATVNVALNTSTMGTLAMAGTTTDALGQVNGTFTAGTKPGAVKITAVITYNDGGTITSVTKEYVQNIDHDVASKAVFDYKSEVTVASETPFNITFTDKYLNPIDNRNPNEIHTINLHIGSVKNQAAFDNSGTYVKDITMYLDAQGKVSVKVLTDIVAGENIIAMAPFGEVNGKLTDYEYIVGITNGVPFSITQAVTPNNPASFPADGASNHLFTFIYSLNDKFGNIASNQSVQVHTDFGDPDQTLTSNDYGQISFNYGPHTTAGNVTITATSLSNTSVTCSYEVQYYNTTPVNMAFSASPETMPSIDANKTQTSALSAKVMDVMGNPVAGQPVTFAIGAASYDTAYVSSAPVLVNTTAFTDSNGYATVTFIPGGFNTTNNKYGLFSPTATGTTVVTATWNGISQNIQLTWKNYPYLKIKAVADPLLASVNGTINVTISMVGDGWALNGKPADVVIVTDLAGGVGGGDLLKLTKAADTAFVKNATNTTWIGLVSFGDGPNAYSTNASLLYTNQTKPGVVNNYSLFNPYGSVTDWCLVKPSLWTQGNAQAPSTIINAPGYKRAGWYIANGPWPTSNNHYTYFNSYSDATIDHDFVVHQAELSSKALQNTIAGYNGVGGTNYAAGVNAALQLFAKNPNPTHTKSIIIMGDGIPMMAPLAPGSLESYWPSDWYPRSTLGWEDESDTAINAAVDAANRAKAQGITVYAAGYPLNNQVDTATLQKMVSSSDTYYYSPDPKSLTAMMLAIQGKIQTDAGVNTTMSLDFNNASASYGNTMFDYVYNPPASTTITWQNGTTTVIDQTAEWNANHQLNFNIGTIKLGQTWQTSFQLKAKQQGILDVCGNNSQIVFNNGADFQNVSGCTVTVVSDQHNLGFTPLKIDISDLHITNPNTTITDFVPLQWNITYPGNQTAIELIYYSTDNSQWKLDKTWVIPNGTRTETYYLDVRNLPVGTYYIEVQGTAPDAGSDIESLSTGFNVGTAQKAYIKLE